MLVILSSFSFCSSMSVTATATAWSSSLLLFFALFCAFSVCSFFCWHAQGTFFPSPTTTTFTTSPTPLYKPALWLSCCPWLMMLLLQSRLPPSLLLQSVVFEFNLFCDLWHLFSFPSLKYMKLLREVRLVHGKFVGNFVREHRHPYTCSCVYYEKLN